MAHCHIKLFFVILVRNAVREACTSRTSSRHLHPMFLASEIPTLSQLENLRKLETLLFFVP